MGTYEALLKAQAQRTTQRSPRSERKKRQPAPPTTRPIDPSATRPTKSPPDESTDRSTSRSPVPSTAQPTVPQTQPSPARPIRRTLQRRSFEFYIDQLEALRHSSLESQLLGEGISMSEMIRTALDRYLRDEGLSTLPADDPTNRPPDPSGRSTE